MTKINANLDDHAKPRIENGVFARLCVYDGKPPQYLLVTYSDHTNTMEVHGANGAEELNLTLSYFPNNAVLAVIPSNLDNDFPDERDFDTIADLVAKPYIPFYMDYDMGKKEFALSQKELDAIAERDGKNTGKVSEDDHLQGEFKKAESPFKLVENTGRTVDEGAKRDATHLILVVDNDL